MMRGSVWGRDGPSPRGLVSNSVDRSGIGVLLGGELGGS